MWAQFLAKIDSIKVMLEDTKPLIAESIVVRQPEPETTVRVPGKVLQDAFIRFLEHNSAKEFSRNLRRALLEHLMCQGAIESVFLFDTLTGLDGLFALLEVAEDEWPTYVSNRAHPPTHISVTPKASGDADASGVR
jgi:hypothetical protein